MERERLSRRPLVAALRTAAVHDVANISSRWETVWDVKKKLPKVFIARIVTSVAVLNSRSLHLVHFSVCVCCWKSSAPTQIRGDVLCSVIINYTKTLSTDKNTDMVPSLHDTLNKYFHSSVHCYTSVQHKKRYISICVFLHFKFIYQLIKQNKYLISQFLFINEWFTEVEGIDLLMKVCQSRQILEFPTFLEFLQTAQILDICFVF